MSYAEKIFKGSTAVLLAAIAAAIVGYLLRLFLARGLSVADFGMLYSILAFVGIFSLFKDMGLGATLVKFLAEFAGTEKHEHIKPSILTVGVIQLAVTFAIMIPIIVFSDYIAIAYFKTIGASIPLKLIAVSFIAGTVMTTLQQAAQGLGHVNIYGLVEPIRITMTFALTFFLLYLGVVGVSYAYVGAAIVSTAFLAVALKSKKSVRGKTGFDRALTAKLLKFALPVFVGGISSLLLFYTDTIVLTIFRGVEEVGLYQAALPTSQLLWVFVTSLVVPLLPVVSEMWAKNHKDQISTGLGLITKFTFVAVIPLAMIMVAFAGDLIKILFGQAYAGATLALQILAINSIFYTVFVIFSTSLISVNKPFTNTKITALISLLNLAINIMLIPKYGIAAAAFTTTVCYFIGAFLAIYFLRRTVAVNMNIMPFVKMCVGGVLCLGIIFATKSLVAFNVWAEIIISLGIGLTFYSVFVLKTKSITREELKFLNKLNLPVPKFIERIITKLSS